MKFSLPYYCFIGCKAPLYQMTRIIDDIRGPLHRKRQCTFSIDVLNAHFMQSGVYHNQPTSMTIVYSPRIAPDFTFVSINKSFPFEFTIGTKDSSFEMVSLRFTSDDKSPKAIRELVLCQGTKDIRVVRVMKDPNWKLCLIGDQQPFEEGKSYEKIKGKKIKDYFTMEDMIRFTTNLGCPIGEEEFWASDHEMYCWGKLLNDEHLADWNDVNLGCSRDFRRGFCQFW